VKVVAFAFMLAFLSSFGQTYFIALSIPDIRQAHGLSHADVGLIFAGATLTSGLLMSWVGATLDHRALRHVAAAALMGLGLAAITLANAPGLVSLAIGFFGLRLCGQGLLSQAAVTSAARLPQGTRGRALGITTVGFQVGTAVLPALAGWLIGSAGWVSLWHTSAAASVGCAVLIFLCGPSTAAPTPVSTGAAGAPITRLALFKDPRFLALLPAIMGPPAIITGYFFHQRALGDLLDWSLEHLAIAVAATALMSMVSSVLAGSLIDRFGAVPLTRLYLLPLACASAWLPSATGSFGAVGFFLLMGVTSGSSNAIVTAALAEMYGTSQLGLVRAQAATVMIVSSAITPGLMGLGLDKAWGLGPIGAASCLFLLGASALTLSLTHPTRSTQTT
jgi:MFS family permease